MFHTSAYHLHNHLENTARPAPSAPREDRPGRNWVHLVETSPAPPTLTGREVQCLCWCAAGKSYWESGVILGICERTVSFHMEAVRSKLGAATNAHAVALAFTTGVLTP